MQKIKKAVLIAVIIILTLVIAVKLISFVPLKCWFKVSDNTVVTYQNVSGSMSAVSAVYLRPVIILSNNDNYNYVKINLENISKTYVEQAEYCNSMNLNIKKSSTDDLVYELSNLENDIKWDVLVSWRDFGYPQITVFKTGGDVND